MLKKIQKKSRQRFDKKIKFFRHIRFAGHMPKRKAFWNAVSKRLKRLSISHLITRLLWGPTLVHVVDGSETHEKLWHVTVLRTRVTWRVQNCKFESCETGEKLWQRAAGSLLLLLLLLQLSWPPGWNSCAHPNQACPVHIECSLLAVSPPWLRLKSQFSDLHASWNLFWNSFNYNNQHHCMRRCQQWRKWWTWWS